LDYIIKQVEDFIRKLHDLDIIIDQRADKINYINKDKGNSIGTLSNLLAVSIRNYELNKNNPETKLTCAKTVHDLMEKAYANGVVKLGEGLIRKYEECLRRREELEKELEELSSSHLDLQKQWDNLANKLKLPKDDSLEDQR